jgi:hypothetical protein
MARQLSEKGQWERAVETMALAEDDFQKALKAMMSAEKQGTSPHHDFLQQLQLSNEKHREIIEDLMINSPQGSRNKLQAVLEINIKIQKELQKK